jgi:hypothetical protein
MYHLKCQQDQHLHERYTSRSRRSLKEKIAMKIAAEEFMKNQTCVRMT